MVKMELHVFAETPPTASPPPNFPAHFPQVGQNICHFTPVLPVLLSTPLTGAEARPAPLQLGCPALPELQDFVLSGTRVPQVRTQPSCIHKC